MMGWTEEKKALAKRVASELAETLKSEAEAVILSELFHFRDEAVAELPRVRAERFIGEILLDDRRRSGLEFHKLSKYANDQDAEIARLSAQVTQLQAANTREVEARRKAEGQNRFDVATLEATLRMQLEEAKREIATDDRLLADRDRLLDAIPPCQSHGNRCIPHAVAWVKMAKVALAPVKLATSHSPDAPPDRLGPFPRMQLWSWRWRCKTHGFTQCGFESEDHAFTASKSRYCLRFAQRCELILTQVD